MLSIEFTIIGLIPLYIMVKFHEVVFVFWIGLWISLLFVCFYGILCLVVFVSRVLPCYAGNVRR